MNATLFAILYNLAFAAVVGTVVFVVRGARIPAWGLCVSTFFGALTLWLTMFALLSFVIGPHLDLADTGHAWGNFFTPYFVLGAAIILMSPLGAYLVRTSNK